MHKTRTLFLAAVALFVSACATAPLPPGYTGPTATLFDYASMETQWRGAFFYVAELDERPS